MAEARSEIKLEDLIEKELTLKEIDGTLEDNAGLEKIVQDFYDQNVNPNSLLGDNHNLEDRERAIKILFATKPELAAKVIRILSMTKAEQVGNNLYKDTYEFIQSTEAKLEERYKIHEETRISLDEISKGSPSDFLKKKMKNSIDFFREKPVAGILGVATIGGLLVYLSQAKKETDPWKAGAWDWIKTLGIWGTAAYGINTAVSMYNDDGRSAIDMIFSNPDLHDTSAVLSLFKDDIEGLTGDDRNAVDALLKIANTDADHVFDIFEVAQNSHTSTIDPSVFGALGGVSHDQIKGIRGDNLYIGLETVMQKLGQQAGAGGTKENQIRVGKIKFKDITHSHPGLKFASLMILMEQKQREDNVKAGKRRMDHPLNHSQIGLKLL